MDTAAPSLAQPCAVYTVTDSAGVVAIFLDDLTRALNYTARIGGGQLDGPMTEASARAIMAKAKLVAGTGGKRTD
jgi:hypothetical protein